jgi:hypothetical protein
MTSVSKVKSRNPARIRRSFTKDDLKQAVEIYKGSVQQNVEVLQELVEKTPDNAVLRARDLTLEQIFILDFAREYASQEQNPKSKKKPGFYKQPEFHTP